MAKGRARDLTKEASWRRRLDQHADSGQTVRAWCRRHQLKEATFHWWRRELARRDAAQPSSIRRDAKTRRGGSTQRDNTTQRGSTGRRSAFMPVQVIDDLAQDGDGQIEIVLTGGRCVRVTGTVDRGILTQMLDVLISMSTVEAEGLAC